MSCGGVGIGQSHSLDWGDARTSRRFNFLTKGPSAISVHNLREVSRVCDRPRGRQAAVDKVGRCDIIKCNRVEHLSVCRKAMKPDP